MGCCAWENPIEQCDSLPQKDQASLADISCQTAQMLYPDWTSPSLCHEDFWDYLQPITHLPTEARLSQAAWTATPTLCLTSPSHNVCLAALLYCSHRLCAFSGPCAGNRCWVKSACNDVSTSSQHMTRIKQDHHAAEVPTAACAGASACHGACYPGGAPGRAWHGCHAAGHTVCPGLQTCVAHAALKHEGSQIANL